MIIIKQKFPKKFLSAFLCFTILLSCLPQTVFAEEALDSCDFIVVGDADHYTWDEANGVLTITGGDVEVSNKDQDTATSHRIYIQGTAHVTLDGVNISSAAGAPIEIQDYSDTNVTLTLNGSNTLISKTGDKAAIHKTRGQQSTSSAAATLTIDGSGSLTAVGGSNAAGIGGGGWRGDTHNIIINGGTIHATGTGSAAGIGSSNDGSTWNIVINGGNITANGNPGIGANNYSYGGQKNAAVTGGMVVASSYTGSTPTGGLVSANGGKDYAVYSNYTLSQDLNIAADGKLTVADGAELTVAEGATLSNAGTLVNDGTIAGALVNEGTIYNKGTLPADVGGTVYEQYVTVNNGSGTGTYAEGSTVTIAANAPESGTMFTGWTVELGTVDLTDPSKAETTFTMPGGCVTVTANYAEIKASVTDANGNVAYYTDSYEAQNAWRSSGGTLTVYSDDFNLEPFSMPQTDSVLDLNGHSITAFIWSLQNNLTIKNGTLKLEENVTIAEGAVITFSNVTVKTKWSDVEITNNGTIIGSGLTLVGVTISGKTVEAKTLLDDSNVMLTGIPVDGYIYDGTTHEPGVACDETTLVKGTDYTVAFRHSNESSSLADAGTVTMTITGTGDYTGTVTRTYDIAMADPEIGAVSAAVVYDTLETSAIVLTRANTDVAGELTVDPDQTLALGENTVTYRFVSSDPNFKTITGTVTVTVVSTLAPTGTVTVAANKWTGFLNQITFGLFFKETQTVSVTVDDSLSGVDRIEYIESETAMDLEAVKAATNWTEMKNGSVSVTLEDAKQFIYYVRITDKSGNVSYLSTDGAEYDISAPVIAGVDNGATYYTTQKVTVTDKNIASITLNGEAAVGSIILAGNRDAVYTIVATDKAGNTTSVTVTMKPLRSLVAAIENLNSNNVTSDDVPALKELIRTLDALIADPNTLENGEREILQQYRTNAESLLKAAGDISNPQTGDSSSPALWGSVLCVSGVALIGITVAGRKKKYNR